jgi:Protein of unknown function (DUF2800)
MYRYKACPGSYRLSQGIEAFRTQQQIEWADTGDRIHEWLANPNSVILTPGELDVAEKCMTQAANAEREAGVHPVATLFREQRLWLTDGKKKLLSGKADRIAVTGIVGCILDYKSSYGDQDPAEENYQIRTGIVLAAEEHKYVEIWYGGIVQPAVSNKVQLVRYTREDVAKAKAELLGIVEAINKPDAPTNAGIHCKYCPAILKCESARALLQTFGLIDPVTAEAENLAGYLELAKAAKPVIARLEEHAKQLLKDGTLIPGWQLGKPATSRAITDPFACFKLLEDAGLIDRDTFLKDCVGVSVGDVEKAVAKFKGLKPGAALDAVNATVISVIEFKQKSPSLEKV